MNIISSVDGQVRSLCSDIIYSLNEYYLKHLAWLTAAVDNERIIGAIPIVMDLLNFQTVRCHSDDLILFLY